jgi:hypothetical protein
VIYQLEHAATVTLRMTDSVTGKSFSWRLRVDAGLRCRFVCRRKQDYVLQPVGDPTSEITAPMSTWGRWKRVGASQ